MLGLLAAVGTIDGKGTNKLHSIGAVSFFILLYVTCLNVTLVLRQIRKWDPTLITP